MKAKDRIAKFQGSFKPQPVKKKESEFKPVFDKLADILNVLAGKETVFNFPDNPEPKVEITQPDIKVDVAAPSVTVEPAIIPKQDAPTVNINVPKAAPPNVNVKPAMVKVEPKITVEQDTAKSWKFNIIRDSRGLINEITAERNE